MASKRSGDRRARGTELSAVDQRRVLAAYVHRFTGEHRPQWANDPRPDGAAYPVQFKDDADWLANTFFKVRADGRLDERARYCESTPTWPNGKPKSAAVQSQFSESPKQELS
jgi:hypothetical protein